MKRDFDIVAFLDKFEYATTRQIKELFFPNTSIQFCCRKLTKLTERGLLKRQRYILDNQYLYYTKKINLHTEHRVRLVDVYVWLTKNDFVVDKFEIEPTFCEMRPDGYAECIVDNKYIQYLFIEIHRHNKFNQEKYEKLFRSWTKSYFPPVIIYTETRIKLKDSKIKYIVVRDLDELKRELANL